MEAYRRPSDSGNRRWQMGVLCRKAERRESQRSCRVDGNVRKISQNRSRWRASEQSSLAPGVSVGRRSVDKEGLSRFLTFSVDAAFYATLDASIAATNPMFRPSAAAFRENLGAVVSTVSLPSAITSRFLNVFRNEMEDMTVAQCADNIAEPGLFEPASELLRQGTALTWTALEVLCNDLFVALLNRFPEFSQVLVEHEQCRRRFQFKNIDLDTLDRFGYNVSAKMGMLFAEKQPIDSAQVIRDRFRCLGAWHPSSATCPQSRPSLASQSEEKSDTAQACDRRSTLSLKYRRHSSAWVSARNRYCRHPD